MTKRGTYKGNATITLVGEFSDMTFGLTKARLILANLQAVERFVSDFGPKLRVKPTTDQWAGVGENEILDLQGGI